MKKRIIIISVMITIVIATCIFETIFVDRIYALSTQIIYNMQLTYNIDQNSDISEQTNELYELWQNNIPLISVFIQHESIDEIEQSISIIKSAVEKNDLETFYIESTRATAQIQSLRDTEFPYIENIL